MTGGLGIRARHSSDVWRVLSGNMAMSLSGFHAPGRVNLIGEHIDYNDGWVLPTAIDRRLAMAARVIDRPEILLHSEQQTHARIFSWRMPGSLRGIGPII